MTMTSRTTGRLAPALWYAAAVVLIVLSQLSCATSGLTPEPTSMPAARAGLRPEYRVFYDELTDYGDWVLIEPYGFVFRPRTRFQTWSPYYDGFWSPSDSYGWIWVSGEPYGWATYHYGRWLNDDFQGWVWVPGLEWAPAWVAWAGNDSYVGWAALGPNGSNTAASNFHFVARANLGSTDLRSKIVPPEQTVRIARQAEPIENLDEVDRVVVNKGPRIDWVEAVAGPLKRARVEDITALSRDKVAGAASPASDPSKSEPASGGVRPKDELKRVAEADARRVRTIMHEKQAPPEVIPRLKPVPAAGGQPAAKPKPARRDSTR